MPSSQGPQIYSQHFAAWPVSLVSKLLLIPDSSRLRKGLLISGEMLAEPALQALGLGFPLLESAACKMHYFFL